LLQGMRSGQLFPRPGRQKPRRPVLSPQVIPGVRHTSSRGESIEGAEGVLRVRCSGTVGIGTESVDSMRSLTDAVASWMGQYPDDFVRDIVVDFTDVDYRWGDAPVSCLLPFFRQGIQRVHYVATASSALALETLQGGEHALVLRRTGRCLISRRVASRGSAAA